MTLEEVRERQTQLAAAGLGAEVVKMAPLFGLGEVDYIISAKGADGRLLTSAEADRIIAQQGQTPEPEPETAPEAETQPEPASERTPEQVAQRLAEWADSIASYARMAVQQRRAYGILVELNWCKRTKRGREAYATYQQLERQMDSALWVISMRGGREVLTRAYAAAEEATRADRVERAAQAQAMQDAGEQQVSQGEGERQPWLWISGETYIHRARIKAAGGRWAKRKYAWFIPGLDTPPAQLASLPGLSFEVTR